MKRSLILAILLGAVTAANAAPIYTDDFSDPFGPYSLGFGDPDYVNHNTNPPVGLVDQREVALANFAGTAGNTFDVVGTGTGITATGNGDASGLVQLTYLSSGVFDLSSVYAFNITVSASTGPVTGYVGSYTDSYGVFSAAGFTIPAGFTGTKTVFLSDFTPDNPMDTFHPAAANSLILNYQLSAGSSLTIDKFELAAVPEPASFAALGLGAAALLRRRRK